MRAETEQAVESLLNDYKVQNEPQKLIQELLKVTGRTTDPELACQYAGRVSWICKEKHGSAEPFQRALDTVLHYTRGIATIDTVQSVWSDLFQLKREYIGDRSTVSVPLSSQSPIALAIWAHIRTIDMVCGNALAQIGVTIDDKKRANVGDISTLAVQAVSEYAGGGALYDDVDHIVRSAQQRAYVASLLEAKWQINYLLETSGSNHRMPEGKIWFDGFP